jgi:hypothetical protein
MADDFADSFGDSFQNSPLPIAIINVFSVPNGFVLWNATVEEPGDRDLFQGQLTAGVTYRFEVLGRDTFPTLRTLPDPFLILMDVNTIPLERNDDSGKGSDSYIAYTAKYTGIHYLEASAIGSGVGTYYMKTTTLASFTGAAEITFSFMRNEQALPVQSTASGVAIITQFAKDQLEYGAQIGVFSPTVYMYEALGLAFAEVKGAPGILSDLANASDPAFVETIYNLVFGVSPGAGPLQGFLAQLDFFESIYVDSGAFGGDLAHIETLARGAVVGQMLGISAEAAMDLALV